MPFGANDRRSDDMWIVITLIVVCFLIELPLVLSDLGVLDMPRLRRTMIEYGAFWPGLLVNWRPNFTGQAYSMFVSYSFLHGGFWHMALNMITLYSLGRGVLMRLSVSRFVILYMGSAVVGAGVYALLSTSGQPMVGASGALFGLAGAFLSWAWDDQPTIRHAIRAVGRAVLFLIGLNVVLYVLLQGQLAWQTHLGGFIGGWILALALDEAAP